MLCCRVYFKNSVLIMNRYNPLLFLNAIFIFSAQTASAQLVWKTTQQHFQASNTQGVVNANFQFANVGTFPVRILNIRTNCGCTAGRPNKDLFLPGETGSISVAFNIENRMGPQEKKIVVKTDNPSSDATLWLRGEVIEGMEINPLVLRWKPEEKGVVKKATLNVPKDFIGPVELSVIEGDSSIFQTDMVKFGNGRKFEIRVVPTPAAEGQRATVRLSRPGSSLADVLLYLVGPK